MFQVGVKHLVVYLNKADIVEDAEVLELVGHSSLLMFQLCCVSIPFVNCAQHSLTSTWPRIRFLNPLSNEG